MPICKKCHRFKAKQRHRRHQRRCTPTAADIIAYQRSRGSLDADYKKKQHREGSKE